MIKKYKIKRNHTKVYINISRYCCVKSKRNEKYELYLEMKFSICFILLYPLSENNWNQQSWTKYLRKTLAFM